MESFNGNFMEYVSYVDLYFERLSLEKYFEGMRQYVEKITEEPKNRRYSRKYI